MASDCASHESDETHEYSSSRHGALPMSTEQAHEMLDIIKGIRAATPRAMVTPRSCGPQLGEDSSPLSARAVSQAKTVLAAAQDFMSGMLSAKSVPPSEGFDSAGSTSISPRSSLEEGSDIPPGMLVWLMDSADSDFADSDYDRDELTAEQVDFAMTAMCRVADMASAEPGDGCSAPSGGLDASWVRAALRRPGIVGAAAGGAGGLICGGSVGVVLGAVLGIAPAGFTLGLSIPVGAAIGAVTLGSGGGLVGLVAGGLVGRTVAYFIPQLPHHGETTDVAARFYGFPDSGLSHLGHRPGVSPAPLAEAAEPEEVVEVGTAFGLRLASARPRLRTLW